MIILLSPAKTLDFDNPSATEICTKPDFLNFSNALIGGLSKLSTEEISSLMGLSSKLAQLNYERFQNWTKDANRGDTHHRRSLENAHVAKHAAR